MSQIGRIETFDDSTSDWPTYVERLLLYFDANAVTDDKRVAALLTLLGAKTYALLRSLTAPEAPSSKDFNTLKSILTNHLAPKPLVIAERFRFHKRYQHEGESILQFVAEIKRLSEHCNFGESLNDAIRDRFVCGLWRESTQRSLLSEAELTLQIAIEIAVSIETAAKDASELKGSTAGVKTAQLQYLHGHKQKNGPNVEKARHLNEKYIKHFTCYRCGNQGHSAKECQFKTLTCNKCGKIGHIARVCRSSGLNRTLSKPPQQRRHHRQSVKHMESEECQNDDAEECQKNDDAEDDDFNILHMSGASHNPPIMVAIDIDGTTLQMELDTGAAVSVIPRSVYQDKFEHLPMAPATIKLRTYSGEVITPVGVITPNIHYQGQEMKAKLYVVEHQGPPLLGRDWLQVLKLNWQELRSIHLFTKDPHRSEDPTLQKILTKHAELFSNTLGKMKDVKASIRLITGTKPKFFKARPVPYALKPAVEAELKRLESLGIITPVTHSEWATPVVPVVKKDGEIRLCGDYKVTVNPYLQVEKYPLPRAEELFTALNGGVKFSKVDLSHAYQQMELDDESKPILTINTHKGLFQVNRLPFGITSASSIFQRAMEERLTGLDLTVNFQDDIVTTGSNDPHHLQNLDALLTRLQEVGLRMKKNKCSFFKEKIEYLGHTLSAEGLQTSADKVKAVVDAPIPEDKSTLRSFLGLVNYYRKFIPDLATTLQPLNQLLSNDVKWQWTEQQDTAFHEVKQKLSSADFLAHYDPDKPIVLACDASAFGLGAVLSHIFPNGEERPLAYASRTLSKTEKGYSQIDKEALALIFAVKRFIQSLKDGLKKSKITTSMQHRLSDFLFSYRNTPHATTHESPAKLFIKRNLRCRMDLLKPSIKERVCASQTKQILSRAINGRTDIGTLQPGQQVYVRDYREKSKGHARWTPAVIESQTGPVSYKVQTEMGMQWRRHQDQLFPATHTNFGSPMSVRQQTAPPVNLQFDLCTSPSPVVPPPSPNRAAIQATIDTPTRVSTDRSLIPPSGIEATVPNQTRYPKRQRKPPTRLNL